MFRLFNNVYQIIKFRKMDLVVHRAADPDRDLEVGLVPALDRARAAEATLDHAAVPAHAHGDHARIHDHALEGREKDHDQRAAPDLGKNQKKIVFGKIFFRSRSKSR